MVVFAVIFTGHGACTQGRQATLRAGVVAVQYGLETRVIGGQLRTVRLGMPEVNDAGGKAPILAA